MAGFYSRSRKTATNPTMNGMVDSIDELTAPVDKSAYLDALRKRRVMKPGDASALSESGDEVSGMALLVKKKGSPVDYKRPTYDMASAQFGSQGNVDLPNDNEMPMMDDQNEIEYVDEGQMDDGELVDDFGMTEEEVKKLAMDLKTKIMDSDQSMEEKRSKWKKWRRQAEAVPMTRNRSINPLKNPSNISPPLTQIHAQTMAANLINYFDNDPFWAWKAMADNDQARSDASFLTKYFKLLAASPSDLNLATIKRTICQEFSLMDKCVVKVPYTVQQWSYRSMKSDIAVGTESVKTMVYHEGPELIPIPQEDFRYPAQWSDINYMPWIAHIVHIPRHELMNRAEQGLYENVDDVLNHGRSVASDVDREIGKIHGDNLTYFDEVYDLAEVYFYHDANNDGEVEDYVWTIDMASGVVLQKQFNELGIRPFEVFRYVERPHDLSGRGIGQLCEGLQDEVEGIHNVRNDNMKLANMRMLTMPRSVLQMNGEELYPGKIWINDTEGDVKTMQLSEIYPSSLEAEQHAWQLAAQVTGQSEVQRGFADPTLGQRDTFRGQAMRMESAKGIFGTIADGARESFARVGMLVMLQLINHRDEVIARELRIGRLSQEEIGQLYGLLSIEPSEVPNKFTYSVNVGDSGASDSAKIQGIMQFSQMYQQWGQQSSQLAMQLFTPQGMQMQQQAPDLYNHFLTIYSGAAKMMEQVLKLMGIEDKPELFIPNTDIFEHLISVTNQQKQQQLQMMEAQNGQRSLGGSDSQLGTAQATGGMGQGFGGAGGQQSGFSGIGAAPAANGSNGVGNTGTFQGTGMDGATGNPNQ